MIVEKMVKINKLYFGSGRCPRYILYYFILKEGSEEEIR